LCRLSFNTVTKKGVRSRIFLQCEIWFDLFCSCDIKAINSLQPVGVWHCKAVTGKPMGVWHCKAVTGFHVQCTIKVERGVPTLNCVCACVYTYTCIYCTMYSVLLDFCKEVI
jgi:hypothetical protein